MLPDGSFPLFCCPLGRNILPLSTETCLVLMQELTVRVELSLVSPRHQVDEEVVRDHALTFLHVWVYRCQDHVRYIDQEAELLESMQKRGGAKESNGCEATPPDPPKLMKPFKPIVITKEMLQVCAMYNGRARNKDGDILVL